MKIGELVRHADKIGVIIEKDSRDETCKILWSCGLIGWIGCQWLFYADYERWLEVRNADR